MFYNVIIDGDTTGILDSADPKSQIGTLVTVTTKDENGVSGLKTGILTEVLGPAS